MKTDIVDADTTRDALKIWGIWVRTPDGNIGPEYKTATRVMFANANRRSAGGDLTEEQNQIGEKIDRILTALPEWDRRLIYINFCNRLAIEIAANKLSISRRLYEQSLAIAIGRVSVLMTNFPKA